MLTPCVATATLSPICSEGERGTHAPQVSGGQQAVAGGEIAICVDGLQTDMRGAGREVRPQAAPDRVGVAPQNHRIDEPVATAVGELSLGEALAQPAVAVVRQRHVAR